MQVVVPSVSRAAVLQGAGLTTSVEIPPGATSSLRGSGYIGGTNVSFSAYDAAAQCRYDDFVTARTHRISN